MDTEKEEHQHVNGSIKPFRVLDLGSAVLLGLNEQRRTCSPFCDVVLLVQGQRFPAHRALLAVVSPYFNAMFSLSMKEKNQQEVELFGVSSVGMKIVMDFLYDGRLPLEGGNIADVLEAAHLLQLTQVVECCCSYLEQELSEDSYLSLQQLAVLYSLDKLDSLIDSFILSRFKTLSSTPDFLQSVSFHKMSSYLSSDQVQHDSELSLLQASLQWLTQTPDRTPLAQQLLSHIRFPLMPAGDLVGRVRPALRALLPDQPGCEALVEEALDYHDRPNAQPLLQSERTELRGGEERLLLLGGQVFERGEELTTSVFCLNNQTGSWEVEAELPAQRSHHCLAVLGGFIYVAGGSSAGGSSTRESGGGGASDVLFRYDPRLSLWTRGAPMNQRRVDFYLGAVGDRLVAVGGRNDSGALSSVEVYCPAEDSWSYTADLPRPTYGHAGVVHRGVLYISGGHDRQIGPYRRDVLTFDPSSGAWAACRPMSVARGWHVMASARQRVYAIGGSDDHWDTAERFDVLQVESCDPQAGGGRWRPERPLPQPSSEGGVAVWAGCVYVLGGYSWEHAAFSRATQVFDPRGGAWSRGPDLPRQTAGGAACVCRTRRSRRDGGRRHSEKHTETAHSPAV